MNRSGSSGEDDGSLSGAGGSDADIAAWAREAADGDTAAFRKLYDLCAGDVHRTARWLLGSSDVDDAVQEVFVRAWKKLPTLSDPGAFRPWLHRLATNVLLRRRRQKGLRGQREPALEPAATARSRGSTPELGIDLERAVRELPEGARRVFVLYDVEGYSHREIAGLLGISHHTSRSQLHRARALLRDRLGGGEA